MVSGDTRRVVIRMRWSVQTMWDLGGCLEAEEDAMMTESDSSAW